MTFLPVLPVYVLAALTAVVAVARIGTLYRALTRTAPGRYRHVVLRWAGLTLALLMLALAAFRPGLDDGGDRPSSVSSAFVSDVNVFFVVDRSLTSRVADYGDAQARMVGIRDDIAALTEEYRGARFNMIGFATKATVDWPLSQDGWSFSAYVKNLAAYSLVPYDALDFIDPTVADEALTTQLEQANELYPDSKNVVFYFGDGNSGTQVQPGPFEVPADLIAGGAVLGYGTAAGGAIPSSVADGRKLYYAQPGSANFLISTLDEARLKDIAGSLDMTYYHREAGQDITPVLPPVNSSLMADTVADEPNQLVGRTELYWIFALLAAALLLTEGVLTAREYRRNHLSRNDLAIETVTR